MQAKIRVQGHPVMQVEFGVQAQLAAELQGQA